MRFFGLSDVDERSSFKPCQGKCMNLLGSSSGSTSLFYIVSGKVLIDHGLNINFMRKQKKEIKLRETLFKRNGGSILEHMLSGLQEITLRIFTADDLRKATNNYSEDNVVLRDRSGITYKGIVWLDGVNHQVTIKKYEVPDGCIDVFIGKLFTLSQINHMNVVKLIGCCLETHSPLLVYNSIAMQSLHDYIHNDALARSISWDIRLRIAAQTAGALASMHSAAAVPIIHGNINSSSILLNSHDYKAKVHDFSLFYCSESSNVRFYIDSIGYMDPECCVSGRLTMKSNVYSFGVVLAELLTGMQEIVDRRFVRDGKIEQLKEVAKIAVRCLSESSEERPTMTQVVIELQSAINMHSSTSMAPPTILRTRRRNRSL
ncbi:hypothetical protein BUALT_Bualt16G0098500 [Buddleja alternifolia]|uniref:Protein kinase domain-containing protein n=1 Tax=Buddleja alternifolia TaxID=168488 RepID=A0AAV6WIP5_9LAMI|nr:hypothetical protein BUALT_Bualt16G0098500 [Buddleja alternifolia]